MIEGSEFPQPWEKADTEPLLREAFASCARVFPEAELDPLPWWLDELRATQGGVHPGPYSCLILRSGSEVRGGITWNLYGLPEGLVGAVGFLWIEDWGGLRGRGLGRQGFEVARELMLSVAKEGGLPLLFILLEANRPGSHPGMDDSSAFWARLGFRAAEGIDYRLPSLSFDPGSGRPRSPDLGLELMLRPEALSQPAETPEFSRAIRKIYFDWYAPEARDFSSPAAYLQALGYVDSVFGRIFPPPGLSPPSA